MQDKISKTLEKIYIEEKFKNKIAKDEQK